MGGNGGAVGGQLRGSWGQLWGSGGAVGGQWGGSWGGSCGAVGAALPSGPHDAMWGRGAALSAARRKRRRHPSPSWRLNGGGGGGLAPRPPPNLGPVPQFPHLLLPTPKWAENEGRRNGGEPGMGGGNPIEIMGGSYRNNGGGPIEIMGGSYRNQGSHCRPHNEQRPHKFNPMWECGVHSWGGDPQGPHGPIQTP